MSDRWKEIDAIVQAALELDMERRTRLIEERCLGDADLRREVESLIESSLKDDTFLETPVSEMGEAVGAPPEEVGPYRILREIGSGGMGVVYLAEQREPVRRTVALKLIKRGMDSARVVARFDAERQALALMQHPNIARVLDAGAAHDGRPYFVMERVSGEPINEYADRHTLSTRARLDLFLQVCDGVQHAHQKGIIHRDIKPTNVLVEEVEGKPQPKIIDFGVAKATQQHLTKRTLYTEKGQMIGTPEYMSPEQAEGSERDIDTRADIYSLGVLLYELLVGALPFDPTTLREAGLGEILRILREEDPPKPSTRLSSLGDETSRSAAKRGVDAGALSRELRGDLDWIAMRALEKDRNRRYPSASELAADIQRYLANEPVAARPPSASYRMRKFVRRNRAGVLAAIVVFAALVAGVVGTGWQAMVATRERDRAEEAAATAQAINVFLNADVLASVRPDRMGIDVTVREAVDAAAERIGDRFAERPMVEAQLRSTLGEVYRGLGEYETALPQFMQSLEILRSERGDEHPNTLYGVNNVGNMLETMGRYDEARPYYEEALAGRIKVFGEMHTETLVSVNNLGTLAYHEGDFTTATEYFERGLRIAEVVNGPTHRRTLIAMNNLGNLKLYVNEPDEALELFETILERRRETLGPEHPDTLVTMASLSQTYSDFGRNEEALALTTEVLSLRRRVLGENHPDTIVSMHDLALKLSLLERYDESIQQYKVAIELAHGAIGERHSYRLRMISNLAQAYVDAGMPQECVETADRGLALATDALPPGHATFAAMRWSRGQGLAALQRHEESLPEFLASYEIYVSTFGAADSRAQTVALWVAENYGALDDAESKAVWLERGGESTQSPDEGDGITTDTTDG